MNFISIMFVFIWVLLAGYILFTLFTKKGRNAFIENNFGKITKDYGEISEEQLFKRTGIVQKIRLLKCKNDKNDQQFFVLEIRNVGTLAINVNYIKLSPKTAEKLISYFK